MRDDAAYIAELERELEEQRTIIEEQRLEIQRLREMVEVLQEQINRHSGNSSLPPSSDSPSARERNRAKRERAKRGGKNKGKRKRGGQPGHKGAFRQLLPPEQVDHINDYYPEVCGSCWQKLPKIVDPEAKRYQVTEIAYFKPEVTEYRRHSVQCPHCQYKTRGQVPEFVYRSPFGPRLQGIVAMLTGVYHLSRRKAKSLLWELLGVQISLGAISAIEHRVSKTLKAAYEQIRKHAQGAKIKHTDGTSWRQAGTAMQLWTIATTAVTVFSIVADGTISSLKSILGRIKGILISDRAKALGFWAMKRRQICWAHLLRKFISFSERDGPAGKLGTELLDYTEVVFRTYHLYKDGELSRREFRRRMKPVREQFEDLLQRAKDAGIKRFSGSCEDIWNHKEALWNFVDRLGVEPTNNHAEQELRAFVLWRKKSFGTQSDHGNRFAERLMTVVHTARKQNRPVLPFITEACQSVHLGVNPPLLLADG